MDSYGDTWAIVLAGGDGLRLSALTTALSGVTIPKQYCSLWGGPSLLEDALARAAAIAAPSRVCTVVGGSHRRWWSTLLAGQPGENIFVQPQNRGTGIGILLALLHVYERDPYANIVLLPADHHLNDEGTMVASLRQIADLAAAHTEWVYLLGAEPNAPDTELGYIVPTFRRFDGPTAVRHFVEKPPAAEAAAMLTQGALVDMFVIAASAAAMLGMYERAHGNEIMMLNAVLRPGGGDFMQLADVYERLPVMDFSRDVLAHQTAALRVLRIPQCGWTDLSTPARVAEVLKTPPRRSSIPALHSTSLPYLNLATQWQAQE